jgi:hypothetical protein
MSQLRTAIENNDIKSVKRLIKNEADIYYYHLLKASELGHSEIVKILLKDPHIHPSTYIHRVRGPITLYGTALDEASRYGHSEVVDILLNDPRTNIGFSFDVAKHYSHKKVIERFLEDPLVNVPSKERLVISKKIFFIGMLEVPEELNDVILHYLFKDLSIFPVYVSDKGSDWSSCSIL